MTVIPLVVALAHRRHRQKRGSGAGRAHRRPVGAVDRHHLHASAVFGAVATLAADRALPAVARHRRPAAGRARPGRQSRRGPAAGRGRVLQGRRPAERVRRRQQWRRPAADRLRGAVRAGADEDRAPGGSAVVTLFEAVGDALAGGDRLGAGRGAARRLRARLHGWRDGRRRGLCRPWPLCRHHLGDRHPRHARRLIRWRRSRAG